MNASRYMILLYASMLGVPLLFAIMSVSALLRLGTVYYISEMAAAAGLFVYAVMGFVEAFSHSGGGMRIPKSAMSAEIRTNGIKNSITPAGPGERPVTVNLGRFGSGRIEFRKHGVMANKFTTVLDALLSIKEGEDNSLSVRYSCRMGICGSCGMVINGKPALACETGLIDACRGGTVSVEPMQVHPPVKDLVTDFSGFMKDHRKIIPELYRKDAEEQQRAEHIYRQSQDELLEYLPFSYCIMCGLCMDACPVVNSNQGFIGPQALSQAERYHKDSRDQMGSKRLGLVDSLDGVWGCEFAGACSEVCPKGVDPAAAIQSMKMELLGLDWDNDGEKGKI